MRSDDIPAGLHLCRLSRWNQLEEDWRAFLDSAEGGGRLVERDGAALGTVTFLRYGRCFSWLSMMLVHPDARRGGIGARLMEAVLEALSGEACVRLDATPLGEPLYRRFGFTGEYELMRAKITLPQGGFQADSGEARPMLAGDLAAVFGRDQQVFGADRATLLESFHRRAPDLAWVLYRNGALLGYCFGRPGYLYRQLGPVVAEDAAAARDVVGRCLANLAGGDLAIDVAQSMPEWIAWLEGAGFVTERPFLRMRRGETRCPGLPAHQFAIAGPEFG